MRLAPLASRAKNDLRDDPRGKTEAPARKVLAFTAAAFAVVFASLLAAFFGGDG